MAVGLLPPSTEDREIETDCVKSSMNFAVTPDVRVLMGWDRKIDLQTRGDAGLDRVAKTPDAT